MEMDIDVCLISGIFTVPAPGAWRVSFSLRSAVNSGKSNVAWLYFNGNKLGETQHHIYSGSGTLYITGGRVWTLKASRGDTISLRTTHMSGDLFDIIFCVAFEHGPELQKSLSAGDEDIPSPDYKDHISAGDEDIPSPDYKENFSAEDEEYFSPDLEKPQSCSSNADCPSNLACIR